MSENHFKLLAIHFHFNCIFKQLRKHYFGVQLLFLADDPKQLHGITCFLMLIYVGIKRNREILHNLRKNLFNFVVNIIWFDMLTQTYHKILVIGSSIHCLDAKSFICSSNAVFYVSNKRYFVDNIKYCHSSIEAERKAAKYSFESSENTLLKLKLHSRWRNELWMRSYQPKYGMEYHHVGTCDSDLKYFVYKQMNWQTVLFLQMNTFTLGKRVSGIWLKFWILLIALISSRCIWWIIIADTTNGFTWIE